MRFQLIDFSELPEVPLVPVDYMPDTQEYPTMLKLQVDKLGRVVKPLTGDYAYWYTVAKLAHDRDPRLHEMVPAFCVTAH